MEREFTCTFQEQTTASPFPTWLRVAGELLPADGNPRYVPITTCQLLRGREPQAVSGEKQVAQQTSSSVPDTRSLGFLSAIFACSNNVDRTKFGFHKELGALLGTQRQAGQHQRYALSKYQVLSCTLAQMRPHLLRFQLENAAVCPQFHASDDKWYSYLFEERQKQGSTNLFGSFSACFFQLQLNTRRSCRDKGFCF